MIILINIELESSYVKKRPTWNHTYQMPQKAMTVFHMKEVKYIFKTKDKET